MTRNPNYSGTAYLLELMSDREHCTGGASLVWMRNMTPSYWGQASRSA